MSQRTGGPALRLEGAPGWRETPAVFARRTARMSPGLADAVRGVLAEGRSPYPTLEVTFTRLRRQPWRRRMEHRLPMQGTPAANDARSAS